MCSIRQGVKLQCKTNLRRKIEKILKRKKHKNAKLPRRGGVMCSIHLDVKHQCKTNIIIIIINKIINNNQGRGRRVLP